MIAAFILLVVSMALFPLALALANGAAFRRGWWGLLRKTGHLAPHIFGSEHGGAMEFTGEAFALRETGRMRDAVALVTVWLLDEDVPVNSRNTAIDVLISAGAYKAALATAPDVTEPRNRGEAVALAVIQINLAEAEYNLGQWDAAEARLKPLDPACAPFPISRAGLLLQRAWIAAHQGRAAEALALCAAVKPQWFPYCYRAEYHFTRAAALLAADRLDEAEAAVAEGESVARRTSSERNALFLRARVAAARHEWAQVDSLCRAAAEHPFRGQGGAGLLLWARALRELGRDSEAKKALRLVVDRDPESESAGAAAVVLVTEGGSSAS